MVSMQQLDENTYAAPQLFVEDLVRLQSLGIKTIVCHRPDGEGGIEQPDHQLIEAQAEALGMVLIYQPISEISMPEIEQFYDHQQQAEAPMVLYCKSGMRSTMLWAAATILIDGQPRESVIQQAVNAGYPLQQFLLGY